MNDIEFNCPSCGGQLVVDSEGAGQFVNCPRCSQSIQIPSESVSASTPKAQAHRPVTRITRGWIFGIAGSVVIISALAFGWWGFCNGKSEDRLTPHEAKAQASPLGSQSATAPQLKGLIQAKVDYKKKSVEELTALADKQDSEAQVVLAGRFMRGEGVAKDELRAVELLRRSAAAGSLDGKINLALAYFHGNGVDKNLNEAARLMREAADVGDKFAQRTLGQFYETGAGVETNLVESGRWYELAAKQGDIDALVFLGDHYRFGRGVEKNAKEAMRYYELAAEKGDASAITCVAEGYLAGEGVEKNESKGMGLLQKAADAGNEKAKVRLELAKKKQALTELLGSIEQLKNRTQAGDKVTRKELVSVVQSKLASVTDPKFRAEMETMVTEALSSAEAQREPNIESLAAKARIPNVQNVELGDLRTTDGHEYQGVRIVRSDQAGITIKHSAGIGTIPWTTLPELVQKKLGYDAAAVATYARIQAQAQAKAAEYARRVRTTDEAIQEWLAFRSNPNKYERSRTKWDVVFEYDVETAGGIMFPGLRRNYCHLAGDARYGVIVGKHLDLDKGVSPTDDPSGPKLTRGNRYRVDAIFTAVDEESGKVFLAFDSIFDLGLDR